MRVVSLLILLCATLHAETPSEALKRRQREYPDLTQIVELAQSAPAEFAARALLRVAQSPSLRDKIWKRELLDQAFQSAASAGIPARRRIWSSDIPDGSRQHMIGEAGSLGLDRLTLQTGAVTAMLALNPKQARELFLAIPQPAPAHLRCEDALVEDPAAYFATAAALASAAFTLEERKKDDSTLFLNERVQRIVSPVELAPAIRMIASSSGRLTAAQQKLLTSSLAAAFQRIDGDSRSFSSALPAIASGMTSLSGGELLEAYKLFLTKNLSGVRCADSDYSKINFGLAPFKLEDFKPFKVEAKATLNYSNSKQQEAVLGVKLISLLFGKGQTALTDDQKNTAEWRAQFSDYVHDLGNIKPEAGESEAAFFYRKSVALHAILVVAPHGESRDRILQEYISFLKSTNFQQESLIEWFHMVQTLVEDIRSMSEQEYKKMLDALEASGHTILTLYARIQKSLPIAPSWVPSGQ